jgi:hypothetical protein
MISPNTAWAALSFEKRMRDAADMTKNVAIAVKAVSSHRDVLRKRSIRGRARRIAQSNRLNALSQDQLR